MTQNVKPMLNKCSVNMKSIKKKPSILELKHNVN